MDGIHVNSNQYLTFRLGDENFAIEIAKVREVLDCTNITKVPRTPEFMRGVINLRGNVVPVIDLRLSLGMSPIEMTVDTCICIVEIGIDSEVLQMGMLTDSVQEVVDIDPELIEPSPKLGTRLRTEFIRGMGKRGEEFLIILDIDKVLSCEELMTLQTGPSVHKRDESPAA